MSFPVPSNTDLAVPLTRLRRVLAPAAEVAAQMERGQAQKPLGDQVANPESALNTTPLCVVVLGLDEQSRTAVLGWLRTGFTTA